MRSIIPILCCIGCSIAEAQVVINEVCSRNNSILADVDGDHPDWIEIHNIGSAPYDLTGHFLSDRSDVLDQWQFPSITISAGGFVILLSGDGPDRLNFNISSEGEILYLSDPSEQPIDVLVVPELQNDHSYGRTPDGPRLFDQPTPGAANNNVGFFGYAPDPLIFPNSGIISSSIEVEITASIPSGTVRYTLDGREPSIDSPEYVGPFTLPAPGTVKARVFAADLLPSRTVTSSFLPAIHDLPIISISTDLDSLFHEELGIYMPGPNADTVYPYHGANFWERHDIPVHFEFFEDGQRKVSQQVDLRIHGGSAARTKPQKPFRLIARDKYGSDRIEHRFFDDPTTTEFKRLVLRNSGGDFCLANFRDGLFHEMARHHQLDIDVLGFQPAVTYINGTYWGILNIRERTDTDHLSIKYDIPEDDILLMQEEEDRSIQGDTIHFHLLDQFIRDHDLNDPQHFAHVDSLLDLHSYIDYFVLQMYAGNVDWPANNVRFWKPSITEGKWRYLLYDLDATMEAAGYIPMDIDMFKWVLDHWAGKTQSEIFRKMLERDEFRRAFVNRFADLMNTTFLPWNFQHEVDLIADEIRSEIPAHFDRWGQWLPAWSEHVDVRIATFAKVRAGHVRAHIQQRFGFEDQVSLSFDVFPPGSGAIHLNTIDPELPFDGIYFNANAIDLSVIPNAGHVFDHWEYSEDPLWHSGSRSITHDFPKSGKITAVMRQENDELVAYPNPTTGEIVFSFNSSFDGEVRVTIVDAAGRWIWEQTLAGFNGTVRIHADLTGVKDGLYLVKVDSPGGRSHSRFMKITPGQ